MGGRWRKGSAIEANVQRTERVLESCEESSRVEPRWDDETTRRRKKKLKGERRLNERKINGRSD